MELYCKSAVFPGTDEISQLDAIYKVMGTPTPEIWPGLVDMPWYELVKPKRMLPNRFREIFQKYVHRSSTTRVLSLTSYSRWLSPVSLDLAERLLTYDPVKRATADQALEAAYFTEDPKPELPTTYVLSIDIRKN